MKNEKNVFMFILWEKAREKEYDILEDLKNSFEILNIFEVNWSKKNFSQNLSRFYGTNLPENSHKEQHCGNGKFLLIVIYDEKPKYEKRMTSHGEEIVNVNVFDKKYMYRDWTGGGHKVHATDNDVETNHDLTLLLGENTKDYLKKFKKNDKYILINQDLIGSNGFESVKKMFYVLNSCLNYAIIRNFEGLPNEIYINDHNDVDIICESLENAVLILNAKKVFQEDYRVHYRTKAGDRYVNFDLRNIGDNYYYYKLEEDILKNRIFNKKGFYTISNEYYYYTLIYHAFLQKSFVKEDYIHKLKRISKTQKNKEYIDYINELNEWLINNNYIITKANDKSVYFNYEIAKNFDKKILFTYVEESAKVEYLTYDLNLEKNECNQLKEKYNQLNNENKKLKLKYDSLLNQYNRVVNSKGWKILEKYRKIRNKLF